MVTSAFSMTALFFELNVVGVTSSKGFMVYSAGDVVVQIHVASLYFRRTTDVAGDIMFLGCPSVCVCVYMHVQKHSPTSLPPTSSLRHSILSHWACKPALFGACPKPG